MNRLLPDILTVKAGVGGLLVGSRIVGQVAVTDPTRGSIHKNRRIALLCDGWRGPARYVRGRQDFGPLEASDAFRQSRNDISDQTRMAAITKKNRIPVLC